MQKQEAEIKINELKIKLHEWSHAYYILDEPKVEDTVYDAAMLELIDLETKYPDLLVSDSPTFRLGAEPVSSFPKVTHKTPLYSLDNAFGNEELQPADYRSRTTDAG